MQLGRQLVHSWDAELIDLFLLEIIRNAAAEQQHEIRRASIH